MAELIEAVASWRSLLLVLIMFGFAPGFCLRLIVLAYPRGDTRRAELIAELYKVPRIERPPWVAEQLEVALFEGLAHRASAALRRLTGRHRTRARMTAVGFVDDVVPCVVTCVLMGVLGGVVVGGFRLVLVLGLVGVVVGVLGAVVEFAGRFRRSRHWPDEDSAE